MRVEKEELLERLKACVLKGDYKSGLALAREALRAEPSDFDYRYQYAKLLGDWADELPPGKKARKKKEAIEILKPLTRALSGKTPEQRHGLCLNYYYQSEDFAGMIRWGRRIAAAGERKGHYAQALGAALLAAKLDEAGRSGALAWARKSVASWRRYGLKREKYYFPHYAQALALAIAGEKEASLRSLRRAARLSGRTLRDWEFADVLKILGARAT
jgi:hypothetical protein